MNYPFLVSVARKTVEKLVDDWKETPYKWNRERDIQVELSSRLNQMFSIIGKDTLEGRYDSVKSGYKDRQHWARVCCEPHLKYIYKNGKKYSCYPDVVIWDDIPDPESPPDDWPILWACEIKYTSSRPSSWDIEKLEYLIKQKRIKFGCWLTLRFETSEQRNSSDWKRNKLGPKLWTCEAYLPIRKSLPT